MLTIPPALQYCVVDRSESEKEVPALSSILLVDQRAVLKNDTPRVSDNYDPSFSNLLIPRVPSSSSPRIPASTALSLSPSPG